MRGALRYAHSIRRALAAAQGGDQDAQFPAVFGLSMALVAIGLLLLEGLAQKLVIGLALIVLIGGWAWLGAGIAAAERDERDGDQRG